MEHVVFHPGPDGSPAFRRFASLEDAVRYVEHLRNSEGLTEVSVHSLSPVPVAFRAYYKVEVPVDGPVAEVPAQSMPAESMPPESMPAESMPVESAPAEVAPVAEAPAVEPVPALEPAAVAAPQLVEAPMAEAAAAAEQPSNGKRSLGFFAH